ncbi:hypothetical protein RFI_25200 [Reticulomyxa filosa]|uniref:Uncharacterized protein n=1 Tax=Reticulomyxa filosa TaxID=46433 RepID=X6MER6_RETFI|nr:hypothetical protein RFI_25200 [Reticulomyxa filosa]|eukprot:ETO12176.1 hypothetical protein RFI_25200 [Reticulomyxa filosa]
MILKRMQMEKNEINFVILNLKIMIYIYNCEKYIVKTKGLHQVNFLLKKIEVISTFLSLTKKCQTLSFCIKIMDLTLNNLMKYREKEIEFCFCLFLKKIAIKKKRILSRSRNNQCHIYSNNERSMSTKFQLDRISEEYKKFQENMKKLQKEKGSVEEKAIMKKKHNKDCKLVNGISNSNSTGIDTNEKKNRILDLIQEIYIHLSQDDSADALVQSDFNVDINYDLAFQVNMLHFVKIFDLKKYKK